VHPPKPRAILFDLDDTLIAHNFGLPDCWKLAIEQLYCSTCTPKERNRLCDDIKRVSGTYWGDPVRHREGRLNLHKSYRYIVSQGLKCSSGQLSATAEQLAELYFAMRTQHMYIFEKTHQLLGFLRDREIKLALITNGQSEIQRAKISRFMLEGYFDHISIEGEVCCGKPDPRIFQHTLEMLGVSPADSWMVGDNFTWEIAPCEQLGIYPVWMDLHRKNYKEAITLQRLSVVHSSPELFDFISRNLS